MADIDINDNNNTDRKARILVADDEVINRRLLEALLNPLGYEVLLAESGEQALEIAAETELDLILLDIMMPGMNGFETAEKLKSRDATSLVPIIMVTALREVEDKVRALESGADDFLSKPVDKTELRARVRSLLKVKAYNDHMVNYQEELKRKVAQRTEELEAALNNLRHASLDTIHRLSRAAEYKDQETAAHIRRMGEYSALVARAMDLPDRTIESILYSAPMHDVGKIGIPDQILLKPGPLSPAEWEVMKTHTTIGSRILRGASSRFLKLGEVIALTHHERWDGSGYPQGLAGTEIPLAGRITAIADVFDALVSKRPYKEACSLEKSLDIIMEGRGSHFDPDVVDAFFCVKDQVVEILKENPDQNESLLVQIAGAAQ